MNRPLALILFFLFVSLVACSKEQQPTNTNNANTLQVLRLNDKAKTIEKKILGGISISENDLQGLNSTELRILRNVNFARHGRKYDKPGLGDYFYNQSWYTAREDYKDSDVTSNDRANVKLIQAIETKLGVPTSPSNSTETQTPIRTSPSTQTIIIIVAVCFVLAGSGVGVFLVLNRRRVLLISQGGNAPMNNQTSVQVDGQGVHLAMPAQIENISENDVAAKFNRLARMYPKNLRIVRSMNDLNDVDIMNTEQHGPFDHGDIQSTSIAERALAVGKQVVVQSWGPKQIMVFTAKPGKQILNIDSSQRDIAVNTIMNTLEEFQEQYKDNSGNKLLIGGLSSYIYPKKYADIAQTYNVPKYKSFDMADESIIQEIKRFINLNRQVIVAAWTEEQRIDVYAEPLDSGTHSSIIGDIFVSFILFPLLFGVLLALILGFGSCVMHVIDGTMMQALINAKWSNNFLIGALIGLAFGILKFILVRR